MSAALIIHRAGPQVTVQDLGRSGTLGLGLSRGGAMDRLAIYEGAALMGQDPSCAVLEMAGMGVVVVATCDTRIALTEEGAAIARSFRGERTDAVRTALAGFTDAERVELARLLGKLADAWPGPAPGENPRA